MPSLLDLAPLSKKEHLGAAGMEIEFFGVPMREVVALLQRWPDLTKLLSPTARGDVDIAAVAGMVPEFAAAAICASARMTTPEDEEAVARWSGADTAKGFAAFAELSLPPGISGPFVEFLTAGAPNVRALLTPPDAPSGEGPATRSRPRSRS